MFYTLKLKGRQKLTYDSLRNAYKDLVKEKPHHKITATEIAKRANLNRSTFYQYFADKDAMFLSFYGVLIGLIVGKVFTKEELLASEPPSHMIEKYQSVFSSEQAGYMLTRDPLSRIFAKGVQREIAANIRHSIIESKEDHYKIGFGLFPDYIANHEISTIIWWLDGYPSSYLDPLYVARLCHQYRREILTRILFPLLGRSF